MTKIVGKRETLALKQMPVRFCLHTADSSGVKDDGLEFPHHPTADVRRPKYTLHRSHGPSPRCSYFPGNLPLISARPTSSNYLCPFCREIACLSRPHLDGPLSWKGKWLENVKSRMSAWVGIWDYRSLLKKSYGLARAISELWPSLDLFQCGGWGNDLINLAACCFFTLSSCPSSRGDQITNLSAPHFLNELCWPHSMW